MAFPYKHVFLVGATSGIGRAMAERLVEEGARVTAVGRRQDRLDELVRRHGEGKVQAIPFDIRAQDEIHQLVEDVIKTSPDIDCVFLNAGIQRPFDLTDAAKFNLDLFHEEISVNFSSLVFLTHAFLPFFLARKEESTSFIFTGSNLAIVPAATLPAYSASKAALNVFILCLREQLRNSTVRVIEISPPPVQTELHDYMGEAAGRSLGMPLNDFIDIAYRRLVGGEDQIVVGAVGPTETFHEIIDKRRTAFTNLAKAMRGDK
ncbi:hypothetical protein VTN77DRAFT_536 [Rasamsonia byssochlamydoides]|uniref:uncharacterized protein n=1 Tax=Rasamsonia byssochlamydoides TaxID=89139 RepID=UPI00374351AF